MMQSAAAYFTMFCLLLACRDVFTQLLDKDSHPVTMLLIYCWTAAIMAGVFGMIRRGVKNPIYLWQKTQQSQKLKLLLLGLATTGVYVVTIYGIHVIGASIFNIIDYGAMPILTVLAGTFFLREERPRIIHAVQALAGFAGLYLLWLADPGEAGEVGDLPWGFGIALAIVSPVLTSYCSAIQKEQVDLGLHPDEVLLFRFPVPAVIMTVWFFFSDTASWNMELFPWLVLVGAIGLFLPLLLLCFGFMTASLHQFSSFLFLIPILTIAFVPIVIDGEWAKMKDPHVIAGSLLLISSYLTSVLYEWRQRHTAS